MTVYKRTISRLQKQQRAARKRRAVKIRANAAKMRETYRLAGIDGR